MVILGRLRFYGKPIPKSEEINGFRSEQVSCGEKTKSSPVGLVIISFSFGFVAYSP
jgi:hypothetical protein